MRYQFAISFLGMNFKLYAQPVCYYCIKSKTETRFQGRSDWQYKDVYRKTIENQHHACILDANYYLSTYNIPFKLASSTELKKSFVIDSVLPLYTKV